MRQQDVAASLPMPTPSLSQESRLMVPMADPVVEKYRKALAVWAAGLSSLGPLDRIPTPRPKPDNRTGSEEVCSQRTALYEEAVQHFTALRVAWLERNDLRRAM